MANKRHWYSRIYIWIVLVLVIGLGVGAWQFLSAKTEKPSYIFGTVDRGDIVTQVAMTGTLAAVTTVAVGTQVSGTVSELYADFNSEVKKDQILAKLDPALFQTQVDQADASVKTSQAILNNDLANIATMKANIEKAKVDVVNNTRRYKMIKELYDEGLETKDDIDSAQAAMDSSVAAQVAAQAQLDAAQSGLKADQARLDQAVANLKNAQVNLEHTIITSPISGTVISRAVDRGQTVAASFSTPTMFSIGEDLTKMQVVTNTDEADVGKLKDGMEATFTVDAYPAETFRGRIRQVRLASSTVNNVVTYNAVIDVPNPDLRLKPGMTANIKVEIEKVQNALRIPNAAIRFKPPLSDGEIADAFKRAGEERYYAFYQAQANRSQSGNQSGNQSGTQGGNQFGNQAGNQFANRAGNQSANMGGGQRPAGMAMGFMAGDSGGGNMRMGGNPSGRGRRNPVWIMSQNNLITPVLVRTGLTDGVQTEVVEGKLNPGDKIILSAEVAGNRQSNTSNTTRAPGFGGPMMGRPPGR
jgi:HlyD family secretion protein